MAPIINVDKYARSWVIFGRFESKIHIIYQYRFKTRHDVSMPPMKMLDIAQNHLLFFCRRDVQHISAEFALCKLYREDIRKSTLRVRTVRHTA
jgi:hypothetical protein